MRTSLALIDALAVCAPARSAVYELDPDHTTVNFSIRHLYGQVPGRFRKFSGVVHYEPGKPQDWSVEAVIDAASIDTDVARRDRHLRSDAFFDVERCPKIAFRSTSVADDPQSGTVKLFGDLTIRCTTKPVVLVLRVLGSGRDPWGNERAGFQATTRINRQDFGVSWNKRAIGAIADSLLGDDVDITINAEAVRK